MKRTPWLLALGVLFATAAAAGPAEGQVWKKIKQKAKEKIEQKAEQGTDAAIDKSISAAEGAVKCVFSDKACIKDAKEEGKEVVVTDASGKALSADRQAAAIASATGGQAGGAGGAATDSKAAPPPDPGEGAWANYDFVPGERVLWKEDFSNERVGNFPRRLEFIEGSAEVVTWNGGKWLRATGQPLVFAIPLPEVLPERFTIEFQITMPWWGFEMFGGPGDGDPKDRGNQGRHTYIALGCCEHGLITPRDGPKSTVDARQQFDFPGEEGINGHLFNVRVQADGSYMKLYLEEKRLGNLPNATFLRGNKLYVWVRPASEKPVMIGNISINAGGKEMYQAIMENGRFATQGILFDVGSDRIRPESTPTLNEIADMMKQHADLKILVEGHTDNTGDAAANQTLSEQRAAAVVKYLSSKGGVDASRLSSKGFGPSKPAGSNDTAEGRQANRRVELVKQ